MLVLGHAREVDEVDAGLAGDLGEAERARRTGCAGQAGPLGTDRPATRRPRPTRGAATGRPARTRADDHEPPDPPDRPSWSCACRVSFDSLHGGDSRGHGPEAICGDGGGWSMAGPHGPAHRFGDGRGCPVTTLYPVGPLGDLDRLVGGDVAEGLGRPAGRPGDGQRGRPTSRRAGRSTRPGSCRRSCRCCRSTRWIERAGRPGAVRSTRILAPSAERLVLVPTSLTFSQWRPWPGFWNRSVVGPVAGVRRRRARRRGRGRRRRPSRRTRRRAPSEGGRCRTTRSRPRSGGRSTFLNIRLGTRPE